MKVTRSNIGTADESTRLLIQKPRYTVALTSVRVERSIVVTLNETQYEKRFALQYKQRPAFSSKIVTVVPGKWQANFNNRNLLIVTGREGVKVLDIDTHEAIRDEELRSVRNFLEWHIKSQRVESEIPRLWTAH